MSRMGINNVAANLGNLARSYLWQVEIPNPVGGGDSDTLMLRCQSASMPGRSVSVIEIPYKQSPELQFAGKLKYDHVFKCEFLESEDRTTFDAVYAWCQQIIDDVTNLGQGDITGKTDIYLTLLTTNDVPYNQIKLKNCFIESMDSTPLTYGGNEALKFGVTFRYDSWEFVNP
jgi:hypothetical protein